MHVALTALLRDFTWQADNFNEDGKVVGAPQRCRMRTGILVVGGVAFWRPAHFDSSMLPIKLFRARLACR